VNKVQVQSAKFVISSTDVKSCPAPVLPEYAFIGRSNVGKSSLINLLASKKDLAKTSAKPGKTQLINHFIINSQWYLVDLPGYGYAQTSKDKQEKWASFTSDYLLKRENLMCLFVLIDVRLPMQKIDQEIMEWLAVREIPFSLVFTKADKLKPSELNRNVEAYKKELLKTWEELPAIFLTSSEKKIGREPLLKMIEETNKKFKIAD
jgi:GTP-binding protein